MTLQTRLGIDVGATYAHMVQGVLNEVCGETFCEALVYRHCKLDNMTKPLLHLI